VSELTCGVQPRDLLAYNGILAGIVTSRVVVADFAVWPGDNAWTESNTPWGHGGPTCGRA
jgi:hypothetical protein